MVNLFLQGFFYVKWIDSSRFLPKDKLCFERNENKCNFGSENKDNIHHLKKKKGTLLLILPNPLSLWGEKHLDDKALAMGKTLICVDQSPFYLSGISFL